LGLIDDATLESGARIGMHEHIEDEIVSYVFQGRMLHRDSSGVEEEVSSRRLMVMNAGTGFCHEESVSGEPVRILQIFVRPREAGLPPKVQFAAIAPSPPRDTWRQVVGPEASDAPAIVRQSIGLFDTLIGEGSVVEMPPPTGLAVWLHVVRGGVEVDNLSIRAGEAWSNLNPDVGRPSSVKGGGPGSSQLVCFRVDQRSPFSRLGTLSGGRA
jgi:redox-sensitive bicupin YhaK (pirin superfamily)